MKFDVRKIVMGGLLLAIGVILPFLFHTVGLSGTIFSPMHIPVLLGGFILGPVLGLIVGILTPILSMLTNGMPQVPFLWVMIIELGLYGLLGGVFHRLLKGKVIIPLVISMILGRLGGGLAAYILSNLFNFKLNAVMFLKGAFITALPGIIIHIVLIPILFMAYKSSAKNIA